MNPAPRFRLSRLEIALVVAVAATSFLCISLSRAGQRTMKERKKSSAVLLQKKAFDPKIFQERLQQNPALKRRAEAASFGILLVMLGSLLGIIRLALRAFRQLPLVEPIGVPDPPHWGFRNIVHLSLGVILLAQWLLLAEAFVVLIFHPAWLDRNILSLGNTLAIDAVLMIGVYALALHRHSASPLVLKKTWSHIRFGIGSYVTSLPLFFGLVLGVGMVLKFFHWEPTPQPIFGIYLAETRTGVVTALLFLVAVAGPVAEELFFRGLLYG